MRTNELTGIFFHFIRTGVAKATLLFHSEGIDTLGPKSFYFDRHHRESQPGRILDSILTV
jgi:hypothetical protein